MPLAFLRTPQVGHWKVLHEVTLSYLQTNFWKPSLVCHLEEWWLGNRSPSPNSEGENPLILWHTISPSCNDYILKYSSFLSRNLSTHSSLLISKKRWRTKTRHKNHTLCTIFFLSFFQIPHFPHTGMCMGV